jgi:hypothetical protein
MYKDQGNSYSEVEGIKCYFPPLPQKQLIQNFGIPKLDQKWTRTELPEFTVRDVDIWDGSEYEAGDIITWEEAVRQETIKITGCDPMDLDKSNNPKKVPGVVVDIEYSMDCLDNFREQELTRISKGHWIYIKGAPVYLTGWHYLYLNWWQIDVGYPEFRSPDLDFFYLVDVVADLRCPHLGLFYVTGRGSGKSFKGGVVAYGATIRRKKAHSGIQSSDDDAVAAFFKTKILQPMTTLPEFLVPINPYIGEITGLNKLEFKPPAKKTISARLYAKLKKSALYSWIDFRKSSEGAYDNATLACKINDELGKLNPSVTANAEVLIEKNIPSVFRSNIKRGFILGTTTIEKIQEGGREAKNIWIKSDQSKLSKNGRTITGLIRHFCSCLKSTAFDEWGYPVTHEPEDIRTKKYLAEKYEVMMPMIQQGSKAYHDAEREKYSDDPLGLISYKQKNPYTAEEAFWIESKKCIYPAEILYTAKDRILNSGTKPTRRGNIIWEKVDEKAIWVDDKNNGKWEVSYFDFEQNMTQVNHGKKKTFTPKATHKRVMAFDPYSASDLADENRGSNAAAAVYNKPDFHIAEEYCDTIIADYLYRHNDNFMSYEDIICACFFFGCAVLIEKNKSNAIDYFKTRGYHWGGSSNPDDFILERPESTYTEYSSKPSDGITSGVGMIEHYTTSTGSHISKHGWKLKHLRVIDDWLMFDPTKTKKFDMAVAASYAVVAAEKKIEEQPDTVEITDLFRTYNNNGSFSQAH